ncbi:hypothetical protein [Microbacterium sp.]|uniref:hypothetical protein n=1 Tax=Microbacterium sp. TaxID=51671 RepID=UPI002812012E|nr:hypothetical protein [Microbacterium sp.]
MIRALAALALAVGLAGTPSAVAATQAPAEDPHPAVKYALAAEPGGIAVTETSGFWPELGMRLNVLPSEPQAAAVLAVGDCATGAICAYSAAGQAGVKLTWSSCGSKSTAALGIVGSIANGRSGTLSARQGTTVRASAGSNSYANVPVSFRASITNVYC